MSNHTRDEARAIWERTRSLLANSLPATTLRLWIDPLEPLSTSDGILYLAGSATVQAWVERRYGQQIRTALRSLAVGLEDFAFAAEEAGSSRGGGELQSLPQDPGQSFERFVIGPGNRLAHAAALAVAESPGEAYNPLFLHGPPGLGKSHLLTAIAGYMERRHPGLNIHHTTAERFTSEFVTALRKDGPARFKARYRELDALLIDDIQVLEGKPRTEEEFVHTFNALHGAGKQIVLSSDRPPAAFTEIEARLRDRFSWGFCEAVSEPDLRTKVALLWRIAAASSLEIPDPALLRRIAARAPGNVRGLEGAMTKVLAYGSLLGQPIDECLIDRALGRGQATVPGLGGPRRLTVTEIQEATADALGLSLEQLLSSGRSPKVAQARQLAMYLCRQSTGMSLAQIAREFKRDHTTVMYAIRKVEGRIEPGSETERSVERIRELLGTSSGAAGPDMVGGPQVRASSTEPSTASIRLGGAIEQPHSPDINNADTSD
ncbi:MAG: chromosomal replication initiator protein DnaA [Solirubrobacterales bacterium]|nr:chromosomal replication initiator protein DnaA [Solirubrobacterales bacterium]